MAYRYMGLFVIILDQQMKGGSAGNYCIEMYNGGKFLTDKEVIRDEGNLEEI